MDKIVFIRDNFKTTIGFLKDDSDFLNDRFLDYMQPWYICNEDGNYIYFTYND